MKYGRRSLRSTIPASDTTIPTYAKSGMDAMMRATEGRSRSVKVSRSTPYSTHSTGTTTKQKRTFSVSMT